MDDKKVIVSVAAVAGPDPVDPVSLADDVACCVSKGASLCHLHCKTREGKLTPDTACSQSLLSASAQRPT